MDSSPDYTLTIDALSACQKIPKSKPYKLVREYKISFKNRPPLAFRKVNMPKTIGLRKYDQVITSQEVMRVIGQAASL